MLPAVGFKAWHTGVRYRKQTAFQSLTTGRTIQSPMGHIRYLNPFDRLHTIESGTKVVGGWGGGGLNSAQHTSLRTVCFRWKVLNLPPISVRLMDRFSSQLIGGRMTRENRQNLLHPFMAQKYNLEWSWTAYSSCISQAETLKPYITTVFGCLKWN